MKLARSATLLLSVILVAWIVLILLAVLFVEGSLWLATALHAQHDLGMDTQTTHNYASSSGILPIMVAALGFSTIGVTAWRHINCHTPGCPRIGKHRMAGGKYVICTPCLKKGDDIPQTLTVEHIHAEHKKHVAAHATPKPRTPKANPKP